MKALIIDTPFIDQILSGKKIWEMRTTHTKCRGTIALIRKGSGVVLGVAEMVDSIGPVNEAEMIFNQCKHLIESSRINDSIIKKWNHAWVMSNARFLKTPIKYKHPRGAVIWVTLGAEVSKLIFSQINLESFSH